MNGVKFAGLTLALALASTATAHNHFTGRYISIGPSYDSFKAKLENFYVSYRDTLEKTVTTTFNTPSIGFSAGYGFAFGNTDLIGFAEASASISRETQSTWVMSSSNLHILVPTVLEARSVGLSAGVGYRISKVMPYVKLNARHYSTKITPIAEILYYPNVDDDADDRMPIPLVRYTDSLGLAVGLKYTPIEHLELGLEYSVSNTMKLDNFQLKHRAISFTTAYRF